MDNPNGDASQKSNLQKLESQTDILIRLHELRMKEIATLNQIAEISERMIHLDYDYTIRHTQLLIEELECRRALRARFQKTENPK